MEQLDYASIVLDGESSMDFIIAVFVGRGSVGLFPVEINSW